VFVVGQVDSALVVGLQSVGREAAVAQVLDRQRLLLLVRVRRQSRRRDPVQPPAAQRAVVQVLAVVADGDAVGAERQVLRLARLRALHQGPALDDGLELVVRLRRGVVVQPPPALAGVQIDDDDAVGPLRRRVGDVRDALALAQVEADVVEV